MPSSSTTKSRNASPALPADYSAAREGLGHRVRRGVVAVDGAAGTEFLQGQITQDARGLAPGESRPAAGLTPKGKLLFFGRLVQDVRAERALLLVPADAAPAVAAHLSKYAAFQKVSVRDATGDYVRVALYGPGAAAAPAPPGVVRIPPEWEFAGELLSPSDAGETVLGELSAAGSVEIAEYTAEVLRVEAGRPRWLQDATETNLAQEVGLEAAISWTKGCYVGQEIVARTKTYGRVNRRLAGFRFPVDPLPAGTSFSDAENPKLELARVTSSVLSPRLGAIGLGLVFREVAEGASLARPGAAAPEAVVCGLPFP